MCTFIAQPEFKYFATSDQTSHLLGVECVQLKHPQPGVGPTDWYRFWKLLQLFEGLP